MLRLLLAITIATSALTIITPSGHACINGVKAQIDTTVRAISKAERLERSGHYAKAIRTIEMTNLDRAPAGLRVRAKTVLASATIHSKGALNRDGKASKVKNTKAQSANLKWAVKQIQYFIHKEGDSPRLEILLAEGLAQTGEESEALSILERLDKNGLIVSASGYATLAQLRQLEGDIEGSEKARLRCRQLSPRPGICGGSVTPKLSGGAKIKG